MSETNVLVVTVKDQLPNVQAVIQFVWAYKGKNTPQDAHRKYMYTVLLNPKPLRKPNELAIKCEL